MSEKINIAIDGPAASGKSTTARLLAQKLGYLYIDTGAMYRAATLAILRADCDFEDEQRVLRILAENDLRVMSERNGQRTLLNSEDVSSQLRSPQIDAHISRLSAYRGVREIMVAKQQHMAREGGVIMDGRDIGTVVLPRARLKVFLIASLEVRSKRRLQELQAKGIEARYEDVKREIQRRDDLDSKRALAPLRKAEDARELDTSGLTIEQQVHIVYQWALHEIDAGKPSA